MIARRGSLLSLITLALLGAGCGGAAITFALLSAGCGGAARQEVPPARPGHPQQDVQPEPHAPQAEEHEMESGDEAAPVEEDAEEAERFAAPPGRAVAPSAKPAEGAAAPTPTLQTELQQALMQLQEAESRLSRGPADCVRACKSLESMKRSAAHICKLEPPPGAGRCADARRRVARASRRVRSSCGECGDQQ